MLDEAERGVSVSLENVTGEDVDVLEVVRYLANRVIIATQTSKYDLDVSQVDPAEVSEMKTLFVRMNFDNRFRIEALGWLWLSI